MNNTDDELFIVYSDGFSFQLPRWWTAKYGKRTISMWIAFEWRESNTLLKRWCHTCTLLYLRSRWYLHFTKHTLKLAFHIFAAWMFPFSVQPHTTTTTIHFYSWFGGLAWCIEYSLTSILECVRHTFFAHTHRSISIRKVYVSNFVQLKWITIIMKWKKDEN